MTAVLVVETLAEPVIDCWDCGGEIDQSDAVVWEPAPEVYPLAVVPVHPGCAARNGWPIRWPGD